MTEVRAARVASMHRGLRLRPGFRLPPPRLISPHTGTPTFSLPAVSPARSLNTKSLDLGRNTDLLASRALKLWALMTVRLDTDVNGSPSTPICSGDAPSSGCVGVWRGGNGNSNEMGASHAYVCLRRGKLSPGHGTLSSRPTSESTVALECALRLRSRSQLEPPSSV